MDVYNLVKKWFWFDWMVFLLRIIFFVSILITACSQYGAAPIPLWVTLLWGILAFSAPWFCLQLHYIYYLIAEIVITGSLCLFLAYLFPASYSIFLAPAFMIASNSAHKSYRWSGPVVIVLFPFLLNEIAHADGVLALSITFGLAYTLGFAFQLFVVNHRQSGIIRDQYAVLEQYTSQMEHVTQLEERNRMSKDLHDTMGHAFTSILMGLEALRPDVQSEEGRKRMDSLLGLTRKSLDEVRQYLHQAGSSGDNLTLVQSLEKLAGDFQRFSKAEVRFKSYGEDITLPKQMGMTLYRCLQESLTNAVRHGQASRIEVSLHVEDRQIRLEVKDNGLGADDLQEGFGLQAMRERVTNLQGQLYIYSNQGEGTTVTCNLPRDSGSMEELIRIVIVDDQTYIQDSLKMILGRERDFVIEGAAGDGQSALELCGQVMPDLVLMDLNMPGMDGAEATRRIKTAWPHMKVLILTTFDEAGKAIEALRGGADGYMLKSVQPLELFETIRLVYRGSKIIAPDITNELIDRYRSQPDIPEQPGKEGQGGEYGLTDREMEILECLAKGLRYKSIAAKLYLSDGTVRNYASTIYAKLGVRNREEAVQKAFKLDG
ncbi:helix-turn-helix transcriptional regulator [Paenibacillus tuaregi]|uniref:helix-turn-helix transcriptional regulator n=1 Tax=Paenibacillus tuaregi TaxID=1816681 RepID=UPI001F41285A|nr:hybrid sensor histidine kinase/response regulator transcription factor [Paenibacillus tuaregi]